MLSPQFANREEPSSTEVSKALFRAIATLAMNGAVHAAAVCFQHFYERTIVICHAMCPKHHTTRAGPLRRSEALGTGGRSHRAAAADRASQGRLPDSRAGPPTPTVLGSWLTLAGDVDLAAQVLEKVADRKPEVLDRGGYAYIRTAIVNEVQAQAQNARGEPDAGDDNDDAIVV